MSVMDTPVVEAMARNVGPRWATRGPTAGPAAGKGKMGRAFGLRTVG
jgi:hypothetical protein